MTKPGVETRDSAGIVAVESPAPSGEWRLAPDPEVRIGMREGPPEYQLYRVEFAARLPGGGVVIVDGGSLEVQVLRRVDVQPEPIPAQLKESYVAEAVDRVRAREGVDVEFVEIYESVEGG